MKSYGQRYNQFDRDDAMRTRTVPFIFSTGETDRHGTRIRPDGWMLDNFKKNPVVIYSHQADGGLFSEANPDNVIGIAKNIRIENNELVGNITFENEKNNPLAEKLLQKVLSGIIRATSVGFLPRGAGRWSREEEVYIYDKCELLEISIVSIPSNPGSLARGHKNDDKQRQRKRRVKYLQLKK